MAKKRLYAEINKVEDQDDGTIKVYGIASTGSVDSDGETITADCMRAAIPDYMKFGAVREMHQPSAAGTALSAEVNADGVTEFSALVVDPVAIIKVRTGVYKGFSVGGKVTERDLMDKKIIKGLNLFEVSLVDRPANPDAGSRDGTLACSGFFPFSGAAGRDWPGQEQAVSSPGKSPERYPAQRKKPHAGFGFAGARPA